MKKILIVDYDQNSLAALQGIFAGRGYEVVTAGDGQSGWDKYNKESPDLVLMEAMLPRVHGFELCQRITSERNSQATVFIMTGVYKDRVYRTEALRTYGASEYFEKPLKMAELLASVEAVLGKPEPRPVPPPAETESAVQAPPPAQAEAAPGATRKPKAKSDDSIFSLPEDLDRLSREIPKARKPAAPRPDPAAEQPYDAIADRLLKTVLVEASTPKVVRAEPADGNGNGNGGGADIDQVLRSALAGFDLSKEKVKAAKPAPKPAAPIQEKPAAPIQEKPITRVPEKPVPPIQDKPAPPVQEKPIVRLQEKPVTRVPEKPAAPPIRTAPPEKKATPPSAPKATAEPFTPPAADNKNTLTPGDPGSDVSPFFVPDSPKPARPYERAEKKPAPAPVPPPPRREEHRPEPPRHEPRKPSPEKLSSAPAGAKAAETQVLAASSIFQDALEPEQKKGFPTLLVVGLGVVALAAAGFVLLRPKRPAPVPPPKQQQQQVVETRTETNTPAQPVEEPPAPVSKPAPAPVKQKPQPQVKAPEQAPAQAILPDDTPPSTVTLAAPGTRTGPGTNPGKAAPATNTQTAGPAIPKAQDAAPSAAKTQALPPQSAGNDGAAASEPAPTVSSPAAAPVQEGDLIELNAVTEPPKLLKMVDPVYPAAAQRVGREGNITVNALINEKGNVIDTAILKGIQDDKGLGRAAEVAVRKWRFEPARKNGVAVKVWKSFVIAFKADANPAREQ
jgi:TonB family protein